eukprot:2684791-Rhodomonas_salina.1
MRRCLQSWPRRVGTRNTQASTLSKRLRAARPELLYVPPGLCADGYAQKQPCTIFCMPLRVGA